MQKAEVATKQSANFSSSSSLEISRQKKVVFLKTKFGKAKIASRT
jgi:hypothetical protein